MHILVVTFSLAVGGTERVASTLGRSWAAMGHQVTFATIASEADDFYTLDSGIKRVALKLDWVSKNWREFILNNCRRIACLRGLIRHNKPDVVVSFCDKTNVLVLLSTLGLGAPVVVSERSDPRIHSIGGIARGLRALVYRQASAVVVQTQEIAVWARQVARREAVRVIPNPVWVPPTNGHKVGRLTSSYTVAGVGRMSVEKGFDRLLQAFAQASRRHPNWNLRIIGEGPERERLMLLARDLGVAHCVQVGPAVRDIAAALREADLFVLSSRYEGFPNALLEAMACGLPAVSFACPSGPSEIIQDGVNGLLVPPDDIGGLANAMDHLMEDETQRSRLAEQARKVTERYGLEKVLAMWSDVLEESRIRRSHSGQV